MLKRRRVDVCPFLGSGHLALINRRYTIDELRLQQSTLAAYYTFNRGVLAILCV